MSSTKKILPLVILSALVGLLTGCQHSMPTEVERPGLASISRPAYEAQAIAHPQKAMLIRSVVAKPIGDLAQVDAAQTVQPAAAKTDAKKPSDSLTLQLGDCLLGMLKMSSGH